MLQVQESDPCQKRKIKNIKYVLHAYLKGKKTNTDFFLAPPPRLNTVKLITLPSKNTEL